MSGEAFDDPNRQSLGLDPIWTGAGETEPETPEDGGEGEPFDPGDHTIAEVEAYLAEHPDDRERVLALEAEGKARVTLLGDDPPS